MVVQREEVQGKGKEGSVESWMGLGGFGVPGLPALSLVAKYSCLLCWTPREKSSVEEEIKEKEEAIRQRSTEVQVRSRRLNPMATTRTRGLMSTTRSGRS